MKRHSTKLAAYFLSLFMLCSQAIAIDVEFYSIKSSLEDRSKVQMTEDLFFTQIRSLQDYTIVDKRPLLYEGKPQVSSQDAIIFHAHLESQNDQWNCTLILEQPHRDRQARFSGQYDSYFKILSEAKMVIIQLFAELGATGGTVAAGKAATHQTPTPTFDSLSGTWTGESTINKVVILRGGRGFVIFNNGASMNITVEIKGTTVVCTQTGKPNASFFPDIPREIALVAAMNAKPITWTMTLADNTTMTGTKQSLQAVTEADAPVGAEMGTTTVTWVRQ